MGKFIISVMLFFSIMLIGCTSSSYPFEEVTSGFSFNYELSTMGVVNVKVLNCYMNEVRVLVLNTNQAAGTYSLTWDLKKDNGIRVEDGLYYIQIKLDNNIIDTKLYEVHK